MKSKQKKILIVSTLLVLTIIGVILTNKIKSNRVSDFEVHSEIIEEVLPPINSYSNREHLDIKEYIQKIMIENNLNENNFRFFFKNVDSNAYFYFNCDDVFNAASTIKVPVAMYYYDLIRDGKISLDTTIVLTSGDCEEGGSIYTRYKPGNSLALEEILNEVIVNSDNTGLNMLVRNVGYPNLKQEIKKYSDVELPSTFNTQNVVSANYYLDVLDYLLSHEKDYETLINNMKQSSNYEYLKANIDYDVAHKYGLYADNVHDYWIVYGEDKYLIGVFTTNVNGAQNLISQIGKDVVDIEEGE